MYLIIESFKFDDNKGYKIMKIKTLLLLFISLSFSVFCDAQALKGDGNVTSKNRDLTYFDQIVAKGKFDLVIKQASEYDLEIITDDNLHQFILSEVKNNQLYIEVPDIIKKVKKIEIIVTISDLNNLFLLGDVDCVTPDTLQLKTTDFFISGVSTLNVKLLATCLNCEATDVANVTIEGVAETFNLRVTDEALFFAKNFQTSICTLKASGYSDITLNVQKELNLRVTGIGNIYYHGNPKINNIINSGTAFIIRRKN